MLLVKTLINRGVFLSLLLSSITLSLSASPVDDITFPFKLINGLIIFEAEIDGVEGAYLLDTGADAVIIDGEPTDTDQLISTPNGDVASASYQVSRLKIGNFVQHEIEVQLISLSTLKEHLGIDLHGIIGGSYFMPNTLIMDFVNSTITITADPSSKRIDDELNTIPFKMVNQIPVIEIEIEGKTYDFALDSGASVHFIDEQVIGQLESLSLLEEKSTVSTLDHSNESSQRYVLNRFSLSSINFIGHHCLPLDFKAVNETLNQSISGILSISQLAKDKVVFDLQNNTLYL